MNLIGDLFNLLYNLLTIVDSWINEHILTASWMPDWLAYVGYALVRMGVILGAVITLVLLYIYLERRVVARFQVRIGPNRVGPFGLLQGFADVLKLMTKEVITPTRSDHFLHMLAPVIAIIPSFLALAVLPFGPGSILANLNVAVLYLFAISTAGTLSVLMAGWSSNNKYSMFGGMRMVAMTLSYEVPMVLSLLGVVMITQQMSLGGIVDWQHQHGWLILYQPVAAALFLLCGLAELGRAPFDLIEGESEITAGYHAEYGGMEFAMLFLREYIDAIVISILVATLFLGGWDTRLFGWQPFGQDLDVFGLIPPYVMLILKAIFVFFFIMWGRATFPRIRIDQVLSFSWKFLLPIALVNVFLTAAFVLIANEVGGTNEAAFVGTLIVLAGIVNTAACVAVLVVWQNMFLGRKWVLQPMV